MCAKKLATKQLNLQEKNYSWSSQKSLGIMIVTGIDPNATYTPSVQMTNMQLQ